MKEIKEKKIYNFYFVWLYIEKLEKGKIKDIWQLFQNDFQKYLL